MATTRAVGKYKGIDCVEPTEKHFRALRKMTNEDSGYLQVLSSSSVRTVREAMRRATSNL